MKASDAAILSGPCPGASCDPPSLSFPLQLAGEGDPSREKTVRGEKQFVDTARTVFIEKKMKLRSF
jgi:hypothetical protein